MIDQALRFDKKGDCGHYSLTLFRVLTYGKEQWWCINCIADELKGAGFLK